MDNKICVDFNKLFLELEIVFLCIDEFNYFIGIDFLLLPEFNYEMFNVVFLSLLLDYDNKELRLYDEIG